MSIRGIWTPTVVGTTQAAGTAGQYQRVGDVVTVFADIRWSGLTGAPTDELIIEGFPFTLATDVNGNGRMFVSQFMAWDNVALSGIGIGGNATNPPTTDEYYPEVFTRSIVRKNPTQANFVVYIGANDMGFPNVLYYPTIDNVNANGAISFTWSYITDDPYPVT